MTEPHDSAVEASLAPEALVGLPVIGSEHWPIHPLPELAAVIPVHLAAGRVPEIEAVDLVVLPSSVLAEAHLSTKSEIVAARVEVVQQASEILDSTQLESLPIATRDWTSLLLDASRSAQNIDDERGLASFGATPDLTVDGTRVRSAFGGVHRGRGGEFAGGESAIREVHFEGAGNLRFAQSGRAFTHIETQRGTEHLHGQMFLFNRQRFLAAQNPFTQWVRETAPGLHSAVPTFAAEQYSPSDRELRWGAGGRCSAAAAVLARLTGRLPAEPSRGSYCETSRPIFRAAIE